jgi:hypothetical protein
LAELTATARAAGLRSTAGAPFRGRPLSAPGSIAVAAAAAVAPRKVRREQRESSTAASGKREDRGGRPGIYAPPVREVN